MLMEARHIVCPLCDRGFTAILQDLSYRVEGYEGWWELLKCPKCETELLVADTANYYLMAEDVSAVRKRLILR